MVYVISKSGKPLMPTERYGKVRRMLRDKLAKVVKRDPFTIQLLYDSKEFTQPITVGVDIGSKMVGVSAITKDKEVFSGEIQLRQNIKKLIQEKKQYRRSRRNRKIRYRKPRFLNRIKNKKEGWLVPSILWRVKAHIRVINLISKILPISKIVVELAPFDTQKVLNPEIQCKGYQNGPQTGFYDTREYCLYRAEHKSEISGKNGILQVHHIIPRSQGGTNTPSNLIVVTIEEHKAIHNGELKIPASKLKKVKILKDASYVSVIGKFIVKELEKNYPVETTYGSITKSNRIVNELPKEHRNDAFVIAGGNKNIKKLQDYYFGKFFRRQNRSLHKANPIKGGKRPINTIKEAFGFKQFDKVEYQGKVGIIMGLRSKGYFAIKTLFGEKISDSLRYSKLILINKRKTLILERRCV